MITAHWSANPPALAACAVVAAVHLTGLRRGSRGGGRHPGGPCPDGHASGPGGGKSAPGGLTREALLFYAGLAAVLAALVSPLGYWSGRYIWLRAIQDLLLAGIAPPLIVLGAPWLALRDGAFRLMPRRGAFWLAPRGGRRLRAITRRLMPRPARDRDRRDVPWWRTRPVLVAAAFNVIWCGWHVPALYDLALSSRIAYLAEVLSYLALGIAFWLALVGSAPMSPRLSPLRRLVLVFGTVIVDTVLGMVLVFGSSVLYTSYQGSGHRVLSVVADQQVAGAVLWMGMLPTFAVLGVALFLRWLNDEEAEDLTAGLERLLGPRRYTWPSGRGLQ